MNNDVKRLQKARIAILSAPKRGGKSAGLGDSQSNLAAYNWAVYLATLAAVDPASYQYLAEAKAYQDIAVAAAANPAAAIPVINKFIASGPAAMSAAASQNLVESVKRAGEYSEHKRAEQDTIGYKLKRGATRIGEAIKKDPTMIIPSERWWAAADSKAAQFIDPLEKIVQSVLPTVANVIAPGSGALIGAAQKITGGLSNALAQPAENAAMGVNPNLLNQEAAALQAYNTRAAQEAAARAGIAYGTPTVSTETGDNQKTILIMGGIGLAALYFFYGKKKSPRKRRK